MDEDSERGRARHPLWRWMPELPVLLALLAVAGGLWAFVELTDEVVEGSTAGVDAAVLKALRSPQDPSDPLGPRWLELAAKDLTAMGSFAPMIAIVAASLGYLLVVRRRGSAAMLAATVGLGFAWTQLLKERIDRGRPDVVPHLVEVSTRSFPSGHATMSAVVYLTLGALLAQASERRRVKLYVMSVAVLATLVIGATRVYLGVHYPTDVLAGWALGAAWAAMAWLAGWALRRRRGVDSRG